MEKSENDMYENAQEEDEYFEYETIEELDESSQGSQPKMFEEVHVISGGSGGNDAVSFLTGILKPSGESSGKTIEIKKITPKKVNDAGFDDPSRKHCCNVCNKKFQKRSNLIDHLRLHANVKVFSCEVSRAFMKFLQFFQLCKFSVLREIICTSWQLQSAHKDAHQRETLCLSILQQSLQPIQLAQDSYSVTSQVTFSNLKFLIFAFQLPHSGEELHLRGLRQSFHKCIGSGKAQTDPRSSQEIQVSSIDVSRKLLLI